MNAQKGFTLIELMIVIAIIGILAAIAIPQYQNYVAKSQVSRVMAETGAMKTAIETCALDGKTDENCQIGWTKSNLLAATDAPAPAPAPTSTEATAKATGQGGLVITYPSATVEGKITATFGQSAAQAIATKKLEWKRTLAGQWTCTTNVDAKYAPTGCTVGTLS
ncbi:pilin [Psychrobacter alimentarius]|uniref:pilin n=1 Tax=Psychrobacter alimentarius TaxID=261164 RepID=UPI003FD24CE0